MIDLYANAMRRAEIGRFEDAVNRLYRVIELISQYRLGEKGIISSNPDIKKYDKEYKKITKEIYGIERNLPSEVGVKEGHILLFLLKDYVWEDKSLNDLKNFCCMLWVRDTSIIAHGLQLVWEKAFKNINLIAKYFLEKISENLGLNMSKMIEQHSFMKLTE